MVPIAAASGLNHPVESSTTNNGILITVIDNDIKKFSACPMQIIHFCSVSFSSFTSVKEIWSIHFG